LAIFHPATILVPRIAAVLKNFDHMTLLVSEKSILSMERGRTESRARNLASFSAGENSRRDCGLGKRERTRL
jgi:hypothetical protein